MPCTSIGNSDVLTPPSAGFARLVVIGRLLIAGGAALIASIRKRALKVCPPSEVSDVKRQHNTEHGTVRMTRLVVTVVFALAFVPAGRGTATAIDYVRDIRPILQRHCYPCHAGEQQKSGLRLDIKSEAFKGGEIFGPSIVVGKSIASPLIQFVSNEDAELRMPPEGDRLTAAEISTLAKWVDEGADWPEGVDLASLVDKRDHWSFKPVTSPALPTVKNPAWPRNAIDRFILARLEAEGLEPAPPSNRATWLRRASFDLLGLPPAPEQVEAFVKDEKVDAYEHVLNGLLNSPRYGERWGQHWLDVVRYADTHGFEVNTERPNAWPYRDYVIEAFNTDKPYDSFIREQIVGDLLGEDAATGFLVTASVLLPGQIGKDAPSMRLARQDALDEIVVNISQTFLGLSVGCARCHDHKFDPISQRAYYSMQALVAGVEYAERELHTPEAERLRAEMSRLKVKLGEINQQLARLAPLAHSGAERVAVNARFNTDRFAPVKAKRLRFSITATNRLEPCLDELEVFGPTGQNVALSSAGTTVKSSGDTVVANRHELHHIHDGQYGNARSWMSNEKGKGWVELEFAEEQLLERVAWGRDRNGEFDDRLAIDYRIEVADDSGEWKLVADASDRLPYDQEETAPIPFSTAGLSAEDAKTTYRLLAQKRTLTEQVLGGEVGQTAFVGNFRAPDDIHLLARGDPEQPKDRVAPAVLEALGSTTLPVDAPDQQRRVTLSEWIASPHNPLTARVMVNRIWQGHFGIGLVETASDFGRTGAAPSHPELLDWLTTEFIRSGFSVKRMHRLIVLSATYRQSSEPSEIVAAKDADVRFLWKFPSRRLEAESIRDSILVVSGRLSLKMGGPGYDLFDKRGGLSGFKPVESFSGDGLRRMIYAHKVRRERDAVFGAFDCPDAGQSTARRRESTTPIQALNLFNSRFTFEQADAFATRVKAEAGDDIARQVRRAYRLAFARDPSSAEAADAEAVAAKYGVAALGRALFNCNEFLFLP